MTQQNGPVKRKHKHIIEIDRELTYRGGTQIKFYEACFRTVVRLINKLPSIILAKP